MDNFYKPQDAVITPSQAHSVALKLWHATGGLYIWEFFTTLDYEWEVIRGRHPYRWTIWIYSVARVAALLGVILCIVTLDVTTPINCQIMTIFSVFFFCLSATASSLLIVIRTYVVIYDYTTTTIFLNQVLINITSIAIWSRNKAVFALAITIWAANIAFHLQSVIRIRSAWIPAQLACETIKTDPTLLAFIPAMTSDMVLLLFVLAGLLVMRRRDGATFGLTRLLWKQGVLWLIIGSVAEIPALVLTFLHYNDPLHTIFETPGVIIMTIATTRMYRSLVNFASSDVIHESPKMSTLAYAKPKQTDAPSTVLDRIEVVTHKTFEQHSTGSTSGGDLTTIYTTSEQMPHIVGDPSKLNLSPESTWPLPAVSSSHSISEAQGV
ncbi:hypothetical protein F5888DRAFT_1846223 [Russula emetica]|nr:hypothetical protein F5888DRAFT_1846223 [Russula emetica]